MLSAEQVNQFQQQGYIVVPNVYTCEAILKARELLLQAFRDGIWREAPQSNETIINDLFHYLPQLTDVLFNDRYMEAITDIIGNDAVWIPECSIHRNRFIHWHKDTSIQELSGEESHKNYSSPLVQAAIYFQPNDERGGGLTVLPGSHVKEDRYAQMLSGSWPVKLYYKLLKTLHLSAFENAERDPSKTHIQTHPGDLLLFDLRIDHRSSYTQKSKTLTSTADKLAIFNTFGPDNEVTRRYFEFMKQRPEPYYRYFRDLPLPNVVYERGKALNMPIWY